MKVTMRNYNGVYTVFLEENGCKELVIETKSIAQANKKFAEIERKTNFYVSIGG